MSLRVGFNARLLSAPGLRGWNRYTVNLLAELPARGVRPVLYGAEPPHPAHLARLPSDSFEVVVAPPMRYTAWEQSWLPRQCRRDRVDVLHSPFNYGLPWSCPCPRVLTSGRSGGTGSVRFGPPEGSHNHRNRNVRQGAIPHRNP